MRFDRAAIDQASAALGDGHPFVRQLLVYEALALTSLGRHGEARSRLNIVLAPGDDTSSQTVWARMHRARLDSRLRRFEAARAGAEQALPRDCG